MTNFGGFGKMYLPVNAGELHSGGGWRRLPKGGDAMRITITVQFRGFVFTFWVKRENRHSDK